MTYKHFSRNGRILPLSEANIPISNIEYSYGYGVYELIKVRNNISYFIKQHTERLLKSAAIIGLHHIFSDKEIIQYLKALLAKENVSSCNIKILLVGGKTKEDAQLFILPLTPLFPDRKFYSEGVKTITYTFERPFPNAKSLSMLGSYVAYKKAKENNCYDTLSIKNGTIIEGTRTNFFLIKDKKIFTQSDDSILHGVTREIVLHMAKMNGYEIVVQHTNKDELPYYDGAFLTSTSSKIIPIKQIDDYVFLGIPKSIKILMQMYDDFLKQSRGVFNP